MSLQKKSMPCIEKQNHEEKKRAQKKTNICSKKKGTKSEKSELKQNCTKCKNQACMVVWQIESEV